MPNNGIPEYFASLRYIERKSAIQGILKAQQNRGYRHCHGLPLFGKNTMSHFMFFKTVKQKYTVDFPPVYGTSASLRYIEQQNQEGDTDLPSTVTVYRFMAKNTMSFFILS